VKVLWAPWRLSYIEKPEPASGCFFCDRPRLVDRAARREAFVLHSTDHVSVIMNRFPYANAHIMVSPREHTADLPGLRGEIATAFIHEVQLAAAVVQQAYSPQGMNVGMNLGRVAGAGVADHLHCHIVPRWEGDTNFMPVLADTRVMPEHIEAAYDRLLPLFEERST